MVSGFYFQTVTSNQQEFGRGEEQSGGESEWYASIK